MTVAPVALAFDFELPPQWAAVDLTDPHWRPVLTRVMSELWSDPKVEQYREAIRLGSIARVELMVDQGAVCLMVGSYQPITTVIGGIFVGARPAHGLAPIIDRFILTGWRTGTLNLDGMTISIFSREITVPGLVGVNLIERIVLLPAEETLISLAFTSAVFGAVAELVEGVKVTDRGIEALLEKISW